MSEQSESRTWAFEVECRTMEGAVNHEERTFYSLVIKVAGSEYIGPIRATWAETDADLLALRSALGTGTNET